MDHSSAPLSGYAVQGYYVLLVACGSALLFSIPHASRVTDLIRPHWDPPSSVFFAVYGVMTALLGLARGSAAASWDTAGWRTVGSLLGLVLFGQFLVLPHLLFSRALLAGRDTILLPLIAYVTLTAFMFSLIALRLELRAAARNTRPFILQHAVFALFVIVPWILSLVEHVPHIVAFLSPVGAALGMIHSASAMEHVVAFAFVGSVVVLQLIGIQRSIRRTHAI